MVKARTVGSAVFIAIGGFLFGYELGIISSTIAQEHFIEYFSDPSSELAGGIVSSFTGKRTSPGSFHTGYMLTGATQAAQSLAV